MICPITESQSCP